MNISENMKDWKLVCEEGSNSLR